ncbi:Cytochrome b5 [Apophysomyces sp. BC1034]|nr:Cytochrome b5 [Apophysomyces sp. BC1015]KAG0180712.1 Cytochrome b5 [Apophysomyces sp. BC1021]KAG0191110.1 Cytochrome b5 [Apophysomyces sp. BC1034]
MSVKLYTHEEVAKHGGRDDLWMIIDNKVYDITPFIDEHPGGEEVLFDEGARDATGPFEDVGHSEDARELLVKYYLGDVDPSSKPVALPQQDAAHSGAEPKGNPLRIIVPLVFLLLVIYYRVFA